MARPTKPIKIDHDDAYTDSAGCFRCHGSALRAANGETISADCRACHVILAMRETNPEILDELGIGF